jgi:hypothetical protein
MAEHDYKLTDTGGAFSSEDLVTSLDAFAAEGTYSSRRGQVLREIKNRPFAVDLVFQSTDRTYGYTNDDRFRDGQTIMATVAGTSHLVSLQMPSDYNDQLRDSSPATRIPVTLLINKWNSVSDAFQGHFALDLPGSSEPEEHAGDDPEPGDEGPGEESDPAPPEPVGDVIEQEEDPAPPQDPASDRATPEPEPSDPAPPEELTNTGVVDLTDNLRVPASRAEDEEQSDVISTANSMLFELTSSTMPLTSRSISDYIGYKLNVDPDVVDRVIMSFWSHYLDPLRFIDGGLQVNVPFVGRFSLFRRAGGSVGVAMQQVDFRTLATADGCIDQMRNDDWVDGHATSGVLPHDDRHDTAAVAVAAAEDNDLDLSTNYKIVLELMKLLTTLISLGTRRIRFPSIGEMYPTTNARGDTSNYKFRVYKNLLRNLASIPLEQHTDSAGDSGGRPGMRIHERNKANNSKSGSWGCLAVIGVALFFFFFVNDGCKHVVRQFVSAHETHPRHQVPAEASEIISLSCSALVAAPVLNRAVRLPGRAVEESVRQAPSVGSLPHVLQVPPRHRSELHRCDSLLNEPAAVDRDIPENLFLAIRPADDQFIDPVRFPDSHE